MNWWPWQSASPPSCTSANAAAPVGATRDPYLSAPPIDDMTMMAAWGARQVANAIDEANRVPGQGEADIEWYRRRARAAEAEARKLRLALYDILGEVPGWKVEVSARDCFDAIDDIALTVLGHPSKSDAWQAENRERRAK